MLATTFPQRWDAAADRGSSADCWTFRMYVGPDGYGEIRYRGRPRYAHRVAWELAHGPIPAGLTIDHLCGNTRCVNPAHLEPVTRAENSRRWWSRYGASQPSRRRPRCAHVAPRYADGKCRDCHNRSRSRRRARERAAHISATTTHPTRACPDCGGHLTRVAATQGRWPRLCLSCLLGASAG